MAAESPPDAVVRVRDLVVTYGRGRNRIQGLRGFAGSFHPGITGLVGPNGAGKSTLLRTVMGLLSPDSGSVRVGGGKPHAHLSRRCMGYLPEHPVLPGHLRVREFLAGFPEAGLGPVSGGGTEEAREDPDRMDPVGSLLDRPISALSMGQRKKVALTTALVGSPEVLLLDEPTNGLDPFAVLELRDTLRREKGRGVTLIVSSHHLDELQRIADALVFMEEGRNAGEWGRMEALKEFGTLEALFHHVFGGD